MATNEWYVLVNEKQVGPMPATKLKQLADAGKLMPDHLVWKEGLPEWKEARKLEGLFPEKKGPPPPPPKKASPPPAPKRPKRKSLDEEIDDAFNLADEPEAPEPPADDNPFGAPDPTSAPASAPAGKGDPFGSGDPFGGGGSAPAAKSKAPAKAKAGAGGGDPFGAGDPFDSTGVATISKSKSPYTAPKSDGVPTMAGQAASSAITPADKGTRFVAYLIDTGLVLMIMAVLLGLVALFFWITTDGSKGGEAVAFWWLTGAGIGLFLATISGFVYEIMMTASPTKGTLGKMLMEIGVVDQATGNQCTMGQAVGRVFTKAFLSSFFMVGYIMALMSPRGEALHDKLPSTLVVKM